MLGRAAADPVVFDGADDATLNTTVSGSVDLVKSGAGTLTIATPTSHTGATTISAGTLRMGVADALTGSSAIFLNNGATCDLAGFNQTFNNLDSYNFTTSQFDASTVALGGATLVSLTTVANNWAGALTGNGVFEKRGAATLNWLWGANTFTGTLSITAGTLATATAGVLSANATVSVGADGTLLLDGHDQTVAGLAGAGAVSLGAATLTTNQSADTTFAGVLSGVGGLTKAGTGTLTLTGVNTYTGATTVSAGTLALGAANTLSAGTALTIDAGASVVTGARAQTVGSLAGAGTLDFSVGTFTTGGDNRSTTFSGAINGLGGELVKTGYGLLTLTGTNTYSTTTVNAGGVVFASEGAFTPTAIVHVAAGASVDFGDTARTVYELNSQGAVTFGTGGLTLGIYGGSGSIAGTLTGTGGLTKTGTGIYVFSGTASYSGPTTVEGGNLVLASRHALYDADTAKWTPDNLTVQANAAVMFRVGGGGNDFTAAEVVALANASSPTGGFRAGSYVGFDTTNASSTVTIADDLTFGSGVGLAKQGAATLELSGTQTITGGVTVYGGTLRLGSGTTVDTTGIINVAGSATLQANGAHLTATGLDGAGTVDISGGNLTLNLGGYAELVTQITGSGTVTKTGAGVLFSMPVDFGEVPQTFTGGLIIAGGRVEAMTYALYDMPDNLGASGAPVTLAGGTLAIDGQLTRPIILANGGGALARMTGSYEAAFYSDITGDASSTLTIDTAHWLGLGGNNSYAGATHIVAGQLTMLSPTAIPVGNKVTVESGSVLDLSGYAATLGALNGPGNVWLGYNSVLTLASAEDQTVAAIMNGYGRFVKAGTGTVTLAGTNAYTGGTTVSAGRLVFDSAGSFASGTALTVASGATADLGSVARTVSQLDSQGTVIFGAAGLTVGAHDAGGTIGGTLTGPGAFTKTGSGDYTISGNASLNGGVSVLGGRLTLGAGTTIDTATTLNVANSATLATNGANVTAGGAKGGGTVDVSGGNLTLHVIGDDTLNAAIAGTGSVTKTGSSHLVIGGLGAGPEHTFSGGLIIADGWVTATGRSDLGQPDQLGAQGVAVTLAGGMLEFTGTTTRPIVLANGGGLLTTTLDGRATFSGAITGDAASKLEVSSYGWVGLGGTNTYAGATEVPLGTLALLSSAGLPTGNAVTVGAEGTLDLQGYNATLSALGGWGTVHSDQGATLTLAANEEQTVNVRLTGAGDFVKSGTATLTLAGDNTYTGATRIAAGTLRLDSATALGDHSQLTVADGATLALNGYASTVGGLAGAGTIALGAATLTTDQAVDTTFSGAISGTGGLTKAGAGTLTLSGASSYSGITQISGGRLVVGSSGALGDSARLVVGTGATLDLAGHSLATTALSGAGTIALGSGHLTSDVASLTWQIFDGTITGSGGVTKTGFGYLSLTGAQSYTGTTTVSSGSLEIGAAGFASPEVVDDANFVVHHNSTATLATNISGTGQVSFGGTGTTTLTGTNTFSGGLGIDDHTVRLGSAAALPTGVQLELHGTLDLDGHALTVGAVEGNGEIKLGSARLTVDATSGSSSFNGVISGTGGVTKTGANDLTLGGANTYTGATLVNAGRLVVDGSVANSAVTVNAGATLGGYGEVGALTIASGGTLAPGNSPGRIVASSATFESGGSFVFEVNRGGKPIGGDHYDLLSISGALTIAATQADKFTIYIRTLTAGGEAGMPDVFDPGEDYAFAFVETGDGIAGFSADAFALNTAGVDAALTGTWRLEMIGNSLQLLYTGATSAVPEPSTWATLGGAVALLAAGWRRRRRRGAVRD